MYFYPVRGTTCIFGTDCSFQYPRHLDLCAIDLYYLQVFQVSYKFLYFYSFMLFVSHTVVVAGDEATLPGQVGSPRDFRRMYPYVSRW